MEVFGDAQISNSTICTNHNLAYRIIVSTFDFCYDICQIILIIKHHTKTECFKGASL